MNRLAITHVPSPHIQQGQRTFVSSLPINFNCAVQQHEQYCQTLRQCGSDVLVLDVNRDMPDCAFVEDTAIVLDEVAVLASMGVPSRRDEPLGIASQIQRYREVECIELPATIEGGDVLRVGRTLLVGLSSRTNTAGVRALDAIARRHGYRVLVVPVHRCLHLKTDCTALQDKLLLVNPEWLDVRFLRDFELVQVPREEPWAANILRLGKHACLSADHPQTAGMLDKMNLQVHLMDVSQFAKAEGGVTCLSIFFDQA